MLQALLAGVASIKAQQTRMNVIGNNLANINTTAFKGSRVTFQDMLSQTIRGATKPGTNLGGINPVQFGLGVLVSGTDLNNEQGSLSATNRPTDMAIQGAGYFLVSNGDRMAYTRDGAFDLDARGNLVHRATGERVLGWQADNFGNINNNIGLDKSSTLTIPLGSLNAVQATTQASFAGNLNGDAAITDSWTASLRVYDTLGGAHEITIRFYNHESPPMSGGPTGAESSWRWEAFEGTTPIGDYTSSGNAPLFFDANGVMLNGSTLHSITLPASAGAAAFDIDLNFGSISQLKTETQVAASDQNGFPPGSLQGFSVGSDGTIMGFFTNGLTRALGQIGVAIFPNPGGMERIGNNLWRNTDNTGIPVIGTARSGGRGGVSSGFLEQSNVDIGAEFTDLIVTQRGFQANTRVVTVVDELLQDLINIKR